MKALGTTAPDFNLPDVVTGERFLVRRRAGPEGLLAMFICRHCPFVKHVQDELAAIGREYAGRGVGIVAISANDESGFPEDSPEKLAEMSQERGFTFPISLRRITGCCARLRRAVHARTSSFMTGKAASFIADSSMTAGPATTCR